MSAKRATRKAGSLVRFRDGEGRELCPASSEAREGARRRAEELEKTAPEDAAIVRKLSEVFTQIEYRHHINRLALGLESSDDATFELARLVCLSADGDDSAGRRLVAIMTEATKAGDMDFPHRLAEAQAAVTRFRSQGPQDRVGIIAHQFIARIIKERGEGPEWREVREHLERDGIQMGDKLNPSGRHDAFGNLRKGKRGRPKKGEA